MPYAVSKCTDFMKVAVIVKRHAVAEVEDDMTVWVAIRSLVILRDDTATGKSKESDNILRANLETTQ